MRKFLSEHPLITLFIVWALGDVVSNVYANHCRLEAMKIGRTAEDSSDV